MQLAKSASQALTRTTQAWQREQQEQALKQMLAGYGLEDKSIDECRAELAGLAIARRQLALPDDLAALCTTGQYTDVQKAVVRLASTLHILQTNEAFSATGISSHEKRIVTFMMGAAGKYSKTEGKSTEGKAEGKNADGEARVAWEWRVDCGNIDGYEYMNAELALCGNPLLQFKYDEDGDETESWTSTGGAITSFGPLDEKAMFMCLECLLPRRARPSRHGYKLAFRSAVEPIFSVERPLRVSYHTMASSYHCKARPNTSK